MSSATSEADIIFNRASVALAKSQRLIASWLPPRTAEEIANAKSEEELEKEEQEIFAPVPELLGIGATAPTDSVNGILKRKDLSADDKLRKQLLGKDALKQRASAAPARPSASTLHKPVSKPSAPRQRLPQEDSEDEEGGRASAFKSRKTKVTKTPASEAKGHFAPPSSAAGAKRSRPEPGNGEDEEDSNELAGKKENTGKAQEDVPSSVDTSVAPMNIGDCTAEQPRKKKKKKSKHKANSRELGAA